MIPRIAVLDDDATFGEMAAFCDHYPVWAFVDGGYVCQVCGLLLLDVDLYDPYPTGE